MEFAGDAHRPFTGWAPLNLIRQFCAFPGLSLHGVVSLKACMTRKVNTNTNLTGDVQGHNDAVNVVSTVFCCLQALSGTSVLVQNWCGEGGVHKRLLRNSVEEWQTPPSPHHAFHGAPRLSRTTILHVSRELTYFSAFTKPSVGVSHFPWSIEF